ncbi:MAG TPA: hypothetical protein VEG61_06050 [Candidatus Dormibacteraeota bacterium]|nr:hypothetical protein [Candidatus Dormibacteraeota bacterium]
MKNLVPLTFCLFIASMSMFYPAVPAAQTTTIYQVMAPSSAVAGSENPLPVVVTVFYDNTSPGYQLVVGVLNSGLSPQRIAPGVVVSSTDPCVNQPEAEAVCAIIVAKSSGVERIQFQLGGIFGGRQEPGSWDLNVTSLLIDNQNNLIPSSVSSKLLKISLTSLALNVNVPSNVAISVDGVSQPVGSVSVGVRLGLHNVTVPEFVNVSQSTRLRFDHWADGNPSTFRTIVVTNSTTLQADYVTQNLLTLIGVQGDTTLSNWYDASKNATYSINEYSSIPGGPSALGLRFSLQGWYENGQLLTNSPTGTISMNKPHTLTAVWHVDYSIPLGVMLGIVAAVVIAFLLLQRRKRIPTARSRG